MTKEFYSLGDVAQLLQTQPHKIHYLLTTGQVPEPARRIGSRRIWTMDEILPLADRISQEKAAELQRRQGGTDA